MLVARELMDYYEVPEVAYCEDEDKKYIAVLIDKDEYVLYPVQDKTEYNEDDPNMWEKFRDTHTAKTRIKSTQINWEPAYTELFGCS